MSATIWLLKIPVETPKLACVERWVSVYRSEPDSVASDNALDLIVKTFPRNEKLEEVLLKVAAVNQIYSGGIQKKSGHKGDPIYKVAKLICEIDTDAKLDQGSLELVTEIANNEIEGVKSRPVFATKYCHWHRPNFYPIRDGNATELIWRYQQRDGFARSVANFQHKTDLEDYRVYKEVIDQFLSYYKLDGVSYRELDKFLWRYEDQWAN